MAVGGLVAEEVALATGAELRAEEMRGAGQLIFLNVTTNSTESIAESWNILDRTPGDFGAKPPTPGLANAYPPPYAVWHEPQAIQIGDAKAWAGGERQGGVHQFAFDPANVAESRNIFNTTPGDFKFKLSKQVDAFEQPASLTHSRSGAFRVTDDTRHPTKIEPGTEYDRVADLSKGREQHGPSWGKVDGQWTALHQDARAPSSIGESSAASKTPAAQAAHEFGGERQGGAHQFASDPAGVAESRSIFNTTWGDLKFRLSKQVDAFEQAAGLIHTRQPLSSLPLAKGAPGAFRATDETLHPTKIEPGTVYDRVANLSKDREQHGPSWGKVNGQWTALHQDARASSSIGESPAASKAPAAQAANAVGAKPQTSVLANTYNPPHAGWHEPQAIRIGDPKVSTGGERQGGPHQFASDPASTPQSELFRLAQRMRFEGIPENRNIFNTTPGDFKYRSSEQVDAFARAADLTHNPQQQPSPPLERGADGVPSTTIAPTQELEHRGLTNERHGGHTFGLNVDYKKDELHNQLEKEAHLPQDIPGHPHSALDFDELLKQFNELKSKLETGPERPALSTASVGNDLPHPSTGTGPEHPVTMSTGTNIPTTTIAPTQELEHRDLTMPGISGTQTDPVQRNASSGLAVGAALDGGLSTAAKVGLVGAAVAVPVAAGVGAFVGALIGSSHSGDKDAVDPSLKQFALEPLHHHLQGPLHVEDTLVLPVDHHSLS